jgi:hypothetical protein
MASSLLDNVTVEERGLLYYKKYEYRVTFDLVMAYRTYHCNSTVQFDQKMLEDQNRGGWNTPMSPPTDEQREKLHKFINWRKKNYHRSRKDNKMIIQLNYDNTVKIYLNDWKTVEQLERLDNPNFEVARASVSIPAGEMLFKSEPKHRYRTYFKAKRVDNDWKDSLNGFLKQYNDTVYPCDSLYWWVRRDATQRWRDNWLQQHFFIDYDDQGMRLVLALMFSDKYLGKHFELKKK